jgi:hypothetical protein
MTILTFWAYNAPMQQITHNLFPTRFSPLQHARACFVLAVVLFSMAAGSYYWHESTHYLIYLGFGLVFAILGFVPLVMHLTQHKEK